VNIAVTVVVTDSTGNTANAVANATIDQGTVTVTSSPTRTWTLQAGSTAGHSVFTATA
jgi:regulator of PEP synthase PpsR (kinase-PPPase family)